MMETRRRNLVILASAALVSLAFAAFALEQRAAQGQPHYTPTEFLPGFAANVKNAALIHIASHDGALDVSFTPDKGWVLPARGNYPADFDEVRHTLIGLATLQTIAPRTDRADWLHYLSLDAPPQGGGMEITVKDKDGKVLAALIAGHGEELGDPNGTSGLFVRHPDDNQAWLARAVFVPHGDITSWLSTKVLSLGGTRLQEVAVMPATGPGFTISRANPSVQIYTLAKAPPKSTPNSQMINSFPFAIANFSFTDVRPAVPADFAQATHVIGRTFDGLLVTFDVIAQGGDIWTRLSASTAPGAKPAIAQQASAINARAAGFAFKLPPEKGNALLNDLAKIMTPPPRPPQQQGISPQFMGSGMTP
jgi:hypothetical protein